MPGLASVTTVPFRATSIPRCCSGRQRGCSDHTDDILEAGRRADRVTSSTSATESCRRRRSSTCRCWRSTCTVRPGEGDDTPERAPCDRRRDRRRWNLGPCGGVRARAPRAVGARARSRAATWRRHSHGPVRRLGHRWRSRRSSRSEARRADAVPGAGPRGSPRVHASSRAPRTCCAMDGCTRWSRARSLASPFACRHSPRQLSSARSGSSGWHARCVCREAMATRTSRSRRSCVADSVRKPWSTWRSHYSPVFTPAMSSDCRCAPCSRGSLTRNVSAAASCARSARCSTPPSDRGRVRVLARRHRRARGCARVQAVGGGRPRVLEGG